MSQTKAQLIDPVDGTIVNADINASAAIAGSKISPDFGSQNIVTTGSITGNDLEIDSGTLSVDASNNRVGIGTTSPTGTLSIASGTFQTTTPTSTGDDITISGNQSLGIQFLTLASGTSNNNIYFGDTDDPDIGMIRYAHASNALSFRTNTTDHMVLDSSGRLLLGVTSDSRTTSMIIQGNSSGSGHAQLHMDSGTASISDGTSLGIIRFGTLGDRRGADIRGVGDGTWSAGSSHPTRLAFYTNASSAASTPTERMRIDKDGHILPGTDSTYNIGANANRFANGYFDTLYGDGSNLTNITSTTINNNANNRLITGSGTANTLEGEAELSYSKESTSDHMLVLGGTNSSAGAWSSTRQGFKAIGSQPLLYLVDDGNTSGDDAYVGHAGTVLYIAKKGGSLAFQTSTSGNGTATKWTIGTAGHFEPNSTSDALNIGSASKRVANIFTNDLHLSNEGYSNDVDGTWGNYTIQEGAEDLFLINKRNGKKYKFNLTEVG